MAASLYLRARHLLIPPTVLLFAYCGGCSADPLGEAAPVEQVYTFEEGFGSEKYEGWDGDFAEYATDQTDAVDPVLAPRPLPEEIEGDRWGLFMAGHNLSDDLFMFLKRRVAGLAPHTTYAVTFEIDLASNAPSGCAGAGGAPGESVYLKAGASLLEPVPVVGDDGFVHLNVPKGSQSEGGGSVRVLGDIANGLDCRPEAPYRILSRSTTDQPFFIETGAAGRLWLLVGTDSGFEGRTELYYDRIRVRLEPQATAPAVTAAATTAGSRR